MAFALTLSELEYEERRAILKRFTTQPEPTTYQPEPPKYRCFLASKEDDELLLPIGVWKDYVDPDYGFPNGESDSFERMNPDAVFVKTLFTKETDPKGRNRDQDVVVANAMARLERDGSVFIACFTGFGKTAIGVYLSVTLGLKTMIICHFKIVRDQWPGEYSVFTDDNIKVQFLTGKCELDPDADVYIVGIKKAVNMSASDFACIGTVIIDEAHIATVAAFTKTLLMFRPRYLIGLSATPDRPDGMHALLSNYFGSPDEFIVRRETKNFTVYKLQTTFKPDISYTVVRGKTVPNWCAIINSIEKNVAKHKLIADVAISHPDEKIIILCNRNVLANGVYSLLLEAGESCALLIGTMTTYDKSARITVVGFKKGGVGLNDPDLTMAIIGSDTKDVRQYEGRIRTTDNIIYHIVDYYKTFQSHWEFCETWYREKGAVVKVIGSTHTFGKSKTQPKPRRRFLK